MSIVVVLRSCSSRFTHNFISMKTANHQQSFWIFILLSLFLIQIAGCKKESSNLKVINVTSQANELKSGTLVFEIPSEIGHLGQAAVLDYLHVFSFAEIVSMAEDYRVGNYLESINLKEKIASLLLDQWSFSQLNLAKHLTNSQIRALNQYDVGNIPVNCYSTYRFKWTYSLDEWTLEKCGPLYECIGSSWLPVKSPLCAPLREDSPLDWASSNQQTEQ